MRGWDAKGDAQAEGAACICRNKPDLGENRVVWGGRGARASQLWVSLSVDTSHGDLYLYFVAFLGVLRGEVRGFYCCFLRGAASQMDGGMPKFRLGDQPRERESCCRACPRQKLTVVLQQMRNDPRGIRGAPSTQSQWLLQDLP